MRESIFVDEETGESFNIQEHLQDNCVLASPVNNVETGEPEINVGTRRIRRKPFQVSTFNLILYISPNICLKFN